MSTDPSRRLEELLEKYNAASRLATHGSDPGRPRSRNVIDAIAGAMCLYAMVMTTPAGELLVRAGRWVLGDRESTRTLVSYFDTAGARPDAPPKIVETISTKPEESSPTTLIARRVGLPPNLARAVAVLAADGRIVDGHFAISLSPAGQASFRAVGAEIPKPEYSAEKNEALFLEGIGRLKNRTGGNQAAVAAVAVDVAHVLFAIERAEAARVDDYFGYASFRSFLPAEHRSDADALVDGSFALAIAFDMRFPLAIDASVSSPFGERIHPVLLKKSMHEGTDFAVPTGTEIHAVADGAVLHATQDAVNGWYVKLDHGFGLTSAYCHASSLSVSRGDRVKKGAVVGRSGSSGRVTGPHLHFQLELNGQPVDPELFLKKRSHRAEL